jgi:hypothetical protein
MEMRLRRLEECDRESYYNPERDEFTQEEHSSYGYRWIKGYLYNNKGFYDVNNGRIYDNYEEPKYIYICKDCIYTETPRDYNGYYSIEEVIVCRRCTQKNSMLEIKNCENCDYESDMDENIISKSISCNKYSDCCDFSVNIFINRSKQYYYAYHDPKQRCIYCK